MVQAAFTDYSCDFGWRTLLAYDSGLRALTSKPRPEMSFTAFAGLSAIRPSNLPPARTFSLSDGYRLGYRNYEANSDVRLVLIHGAGCFGDQLHEIAHYVAATGRAKALSLDLRGHGLSGGARGHAVSAPNQIIEDVADILVALKNEYPRSRIVLGGHSAGGGVVLGLSRTPARDLIDGYIFLAPYVGWGSPTIRPHFGGWVAVRSAFLRKLFLLNSLGVRKFNNETVVDFNMEACLHDPRFVRSWSFNTAMAFGPGLWGTHAAPISAEKPVLVLAGEMDQCFVQPLYQEAFRVIAPHADMPKLGQLGHWDLLVDQGTMSALGGWLDEKIPAKFDQATFRRVGRAAAAM